MPHVYVYAPTAIDFDCAGLCGPLTPTKCLHTEERNGLSEIELTHPFDAAGRWSYLRDGYILKVEIPVRTCPDISAGEIVTAIETWRVKHTATKEQRYLYSKPTGGAKLKLLPPGELVTVTAKDTARYKCRTAKYTGWIVLEALENQIEQVIDVDPAAIEHVAPAWTKRPQLFRIYSPEKSDAGKSDSGVTVKARHVFYDQLGNNTSFGAGVASGVAALAGIQGGCILPNPVTGYTNIGDQRVIDGWTRVNPVAALLEPETGFVARFCGELVRDNFEYYILDRAGINRGVRIAYGKNLLGVKCSTDSTEIVTRYIPVGQDSAGDPLLLAAGQYTVDGIAVTIDSTLSVVSPREGDYPVPHVAVLDLGEDAKATGATAPEILAARVQMIRACKAKFAAGVDLAAISMQVQFVALGDTVEYAQYKRLEDVYLYDYVRVYHPKIGIDVLVQVNRVVTNCLTGGFESVELGEPIQSLAKSAIASWQVPAGIPSKKIKGTVRATVNTQTLFPEATTPPANPSIGQIWHDSTNGVIKRYNGSSWMIYSVSETAFEALTQRVTLLER